MDEEANKISMSTSKQIHSVVEAFYSKAISDPIIGFHFRKIQEFEGADPLRPPIEAFAKHIPRIVNFWRMQLLEEKNLETVPFNLIKTHQYLGLKRGQIDRWLILFIETLKESDCSQDFKNLWEEKARHFRSKF
jgi:truncated hemoglobin YjbI